ncbi:putative E3 ubiquitin-protein ligase MARCH6, partial [Paragonimus heterotremus]
LLRWLQYSKRHTCELCNHRFSFAPIYASGTPRFLPLRVLLVGLIRSLRRSFVGWLHLSLVFLAWLVVVPLTACRIYRCLFTGSVSSLLTLPLDMLSTRYLLQDCLQGFTIVFLALAAFLGYISLREQLLHGGGPAWLEQVAAGENEDGDAHGRPPFFPDLFNLFGAANGAGPGAVVGEDENAEEVEVPQPPASDPVGHVDRSVSLSSASGADSAAATSGSIPPDGASSAELNSSVPSEVVNPLPVQPQQYGWRAEGLGANELGDEDRATEEPDGDGVADAGADEAAVDGAMNWDRLLGLDGSLAFLEHMLWLIALNTLLIVIFAGYWFGLGYVYIKVALVSLLEVGIFPILCGFWIDACTLSLFNATLPNRARVFHYAPVAFTFIHWAIGMLYIFYMASLLILARSVVRPGVLRFVHHFNDPDYKPVQDMIMQPLHIYTQRLIATFSIWGILIVFMLWVPIELVRRSLPGFLPFQVVIAHESPLDYSVEIILIQVVLPFLLDVQAKAAVRKLLRAWCMGVGTVLGIRSYLVGDEPFLLGDLIVNEDGAEVPYIPPTNHDSEMPPTTSETQQSPHVPTESTQTRLPNIPQLPEPEVHPVPGPARPEDRHAREDHDNDEDPDNFNRYVPYKRSTWFPLRMFAFGFVVLLSLMLLSTTLLIVPVGVGRLTFSMFNSRTSPKHDAVAMVTGVTILGLFLRLAVR